ncbi:MAG: RNA polymerase sigma factor [Nitrospinota bacterium]
MAFLNINFLKLLKRKDTTAFEQLLFEYSGKVYRLSMALLKNRQDGEDAVREVFLTIYKKINRLREDKALSSWIYRVTVNACMMKLRKNTYSEVSFEETLPQFDQSGSHSNRVADWSKTPEEEMYSDEMMRYVKKILENFFTDFTSGGLIRTSQGQIFFK